MTIHVKGVDYPGEPIKEEWLITTLAEGEWDADWLVRELESVGCGEDGNPRFTMQVSRSRHAWGASGAALSLVMEVAHDALIGGGGYMLHRVGKEMGKRMRQQYDPPLRPLTEEEASGKVIWLIASKYDEQNASLAVVSTSVSDNAATVTVRGERATYTVEMTLDDGLVMTSRITREVI